MRRTSIRTGAFALVAAAVGLVPLSSAEAQDRWLILAYLAADSDLENPMAADVNEMAVVGSSAAADGPILVYVEFDRGGNVDETTGAATRITGLPDFTTGSRRFIVERDGVSDVSMIADPHDSSTAASLADFIVDGITNYGTGIDHFVLLIGDHGAAWQGCCEDRHTGGSEHGFMSLDTIRQGIQQGIMGAGQPDTFRFDIIGFDQCLMGSFEVAEQMAPYGNLLVASEELEPGQGWAYDQWLARLEADPAMTSRQLGTEIVNTFHAQFSAPDTARNTTLSVFDLTRVATLRGLVETLATELNGGTFADDYRSTYAWARRGAEAYGVGSQGDDYAVVDLGHFASRIAEDFGTDSVGMAASAVVSEVGTAVISNAVGPAHANSTGISIYIPRRAPLMNYPADAVGPTWREFSANYSREALADNSPPEINTMAATGGRSRSQMLSAATVGDDIDDVSLILGVPLGDGTTAFLGELPLDQGGGGDADRVGGDVMVPFDGSWPALTDGTIPDPIPIAFFAIDRYTDGSEERVILSVPVELDEGWDTTVELIDAALYFDMDLATRVGFFIGAYPDSDSDDTDVDAVAEIPLGPAALIRPYIPVISDTGDFTYVPGSVEVPTTDLLIEPVELEDGDYLLGLTATDFSDNSNTEVIEVELYSDEGDAGAPGTDAGTTDSDAGTTMDMDGGSTGSDAGVAPGTDAGPGSSGGDGCGCRVGGRSDGMAFGGLALLGLALFYRRRRRA